MGLRAAVVGHVEWTTIVEVARLPAAGEICSTRTVWEGPAGGGAVAAVRIAALAGECAFFTRLGEDADGVRARRRLESHGVRVYAESAAAATSRALSIIDGSGERTTLTLGARLQPGGDDPLPWDELAGFDTVYFTAGDAKTLRRARHARVLVATLREMSTVAQAAVAIDALVGSSCDPAERYRPLENPPALVVWTEGGRGGSFVRACGQRGRYPAAALPGPPVDTYGVGDNFAASLAIALAVDPNPAEALQAAARDGAACLATRGPYR